MFACWCTAAGGSVGGWRTATGRSRCQLGWRRSSPCPCAFALIVSSAFVHPWLARTQSWAVRPVLWPGRGSVRGSARIPCRSGRRTRGRSDWSGSSPTNHPARRFRALEIAKTLRGALRTGDKGQSTGRTTQPPPSPAMGGRTSRTSRANAPEEGDERHQPTSTRRQPATERQQPPSPGWAAGHGAPATASAGWAAGRGAPATDPSATTREVRAGVRGRCRGRWGARLGSRRSRRRRGRRPGAR